MVGLENLVGWPWLLGDQVRPCNEETFPKPCVKEGVTLPEVQRVIREDYIVERGGERPPFF